MSIKYVCPHCKSTLGNIESELVTETELGWHFLTPEERQHIISYDSGNMIVNVTCEYCSEAIQRNPELAYPLQ